MTVNQSTTPGRIDPNRLAAAARSILACPLDVQLVVDGIDDITVGLDGDPASALEMRDDDGRPVFICPTGSQLARAAAEGRSALITLTSGLGRAGSPDRDATLTLAGSLMTTGLDECPCCDGLRSGVSVRLNYVLLARTGPSAADHAQYRVPLGAFSSPAHHLNRGFLQRSTEHANHCHQDELRRAIATTGATRLADIVGVHLVDLRPDRVEVQWVDVDGAHRTIRHFGRAARTPYELGELLRQHLHAGLC